MKNLKHTKGPWSYNGYYKCIQTHNKDVPLSAICREGNTGNDINDMRLISCAPEMLEVLIGHVRNVKSCVNFTSWKEDCNDIIPLIEKATGLKIEEILEEG